MQWILDNWLLVLLVGGMIVMHLGHGMHGGKGGHGADKDADRGARKKTVKNVTAATQKETQNEPEARPASASKSVTGTSKIPTIKYKADDAGKSGV